MYIFFILLSITSALADVMNLNEFMPTRLEDASVTRLHDIEAQGTVRIDDDSNELTLSPTVRWGLVKRVQLEYGPDFIKTTEDPRTSRSEHKLGFQWKFNDQTNWVPALAIAPRLSIPQGTGSDALDSSFKILMTYTFIGTLSDPVGQFHLNFRWAHNSERLVSENKVGKLLIFGYSHRIAEHTSVVADFLHHRELMSLTIQNDLELGILHKFSKNFNMGVGLGVDARLGQFSSNLSGQLTF